MGHQSIEIPRKMGARPKNNENQWEHTENALTYWATKVTKLIDYHKESLDDFFNKNLCYATEKYDGTNVAKDDRGQVYSRRLQIDDDAEEFIDTNLKKIRDANIADFRSRLQEVAEVDEAIVSRCIVYGELICNKYYDYVEEYKNILVMEVKKHDAEEKGETEEIDETFVTFINHKVGAIIKGQLASLQKDNEKDQDDISDFPI